MKKIIVIIMVVAIVGSVYLIKGCSKKSKTAQTAQVENSASPDDSSSEGTMQIAQRPLPNLNTNLPDDITPGFVTQTNYVTVTNVVTQTNTVDVMKTIKTKTHQQRVDVTISGNQTGGVYPIVVQQGTQGDDQKVSINITNTSALPAKRVQKPMATQTPPAPASGSAPTSAPTAYWGPSQAGGYQQPAQVYVQPPVQQVVYQQPPPVIVSRGYGYNEYPGYYSSVGYYNPSIRIGLGFGFGNYGGSYYYRRGSSYHSQYNNHSRSRHR